MRALQGHSKDVRAVAYTPDGKLVSGGGDRTVRVWNPVTGECTAVIKAKAPVYAVAASPDGKTIAYAGRHAPRAESNFVYLCDPAGKSTGRLELRTQDYLWEQAGADGLLQRVLRWVPRSIWSLAFSADGRYVAAACRRIGGGGIPDGGGGRCWDLTSGAAEPVVSLAENAYAVAFSPAGPAVTNSQPQLFQEPASLMPSAGGWLAVTTYEQVTFYEQPSAAAFRTYPLSAMWAPAVTFVPGADLAVVASNSFLYFLCLSRRERPKRVKTGSRTVAALAASPDGKTLLAGGRPGAVELYDTATRTRTTAYDFGIGGLHAVAFAPDGLTFAAAGDAGLVVCDVAG